MSTNRYLNAGAPGTGTTVDNMASRVKAWASINGATAPASLNSSLGVSSVTDVGVGDWGLNLSSPMANTLFPPYATRSGATAASIYTASFALPTVSFVEIYSKADTGMADTPSVSAAVLGTLA